ncbi:MAG: tetratricopeptide repeat protein [Anaerolineae bacterium]|nr:tetratricopeptide repeat protein [Anaerolineae bacterium]
MNRRYELLGTLGIEDDGHVSAVMKYGKGCALLAYLIVDGQAHSRETVADLLWEATSTQQSLRNLRALLHKLRPLAPELSVSRKQLSFQRTDAVSADFYTLQAALDSDDIGRLYSARALYKGTLLDGFYLDDAPMFWEWQLLARERLHQRVWDGYYRVCTTYEADRNWGLGVDAARRWLWLDPLDETVHQWLMRFLAANGQKAAAIAQYEKCRRLLAGELGVEPGTTTQALVEQIRQLPDEGSSTLVQPVTVTELPQPGESAEPGALPPHSYLPYHRNAIFTGRNSDLRRLSEMLLPTTTSSAGRLTSAVVLTGMGGLGKSQLAVEYAYRYGRYYPGGVFWLNFDDAEHVAELAAEFGSERGMNLYAADDRLDLHRKTELVKRAWQEQTPRLLIFDNCEDENLAAAWLPVSGGCSVLITSRHTTWSKALPLTVHPLDTLLRAESVDLLRRLAEWLAEPEADLIAAEVGDWPLALHLAGSFLGANRDLRSQAYIRQLREQRLLQHSSLRGRHVRYSPTGHEPDLAHTFAVSYEQLDFANPIGWVAGQHLARIVCLAPNEPIPLTLLFDSYRDVDKGDIGRLQAGVNRLIALGFLNAVDGDTVVIHPLLAAFTIDRLAREPLGDAAPTAIESTLIRQLGQHKQAGKSLATLPFPAAHLRYVAHRSLDAGGEQAVRFASLLGEYLTEIADYAEARVTLQTALDLTEKQFGTDSLAMAEVANLMGSLLEEVGRYKDAETYYAQALAIRLEQLGENHLDTAASLNNMGTCCIRIGPYISAEPYFARALAIRERLLGPDHPLTLGVMNNLGVMHNYMGNRDEARAYFAGVLAARERTLEPDHLLLASSLNNLGDLLSRTGEPGAGRPYLERSLAIRSRKLGADHPLTLECQTNLGFSLIQIGDFVEAQVQLEQALAGALSKLGEMHTLTARIYNTLGTLFMGIGRYDAARTHFEQALKIREEVRGSDAPDTAYSLLCLGELLIALHDENRARSLLERALAILEQRVEPPASERERVQRLLAEMSEAVAGKS